MLGGTPGAFMYNNLPSLVNLSANTTYYLLSQEVSGGDQWYDQDTTVQTAGVANVTGPAYGTPYASFVASNRMYGPLDLRYSAYLSVSPAGTILYGGQSKQFTVTITGTSNNSVVWSLNPAVGTISNSGLYIAPATINSTQTVSVTATSVADPSRSATAIVTLNPPIIVGVNPSSVSLNHDQTQQFTTSVQNTPNPTVDWSIAPLVGSITASGLYTAPSTITSAQDITVLAISHADGTTGGTATVHLTPPVPVIVTPGQFVAANESNPAVCGKPARNLVPESASGQHFERRSVHGALPHPKRPNDYRDGHQHHRRHTALQRQHYAGATHAGQYFAASADSIGPRGPIGHVQRGGGRDGN